MAERLIDAELLKRTTKRLIKEEEQNGFYPKSWDEEVIAFKYLVDSMPTIEAKPVVHAHWEEIANGFMVCSRCKESVEENRKYSYCPICGAQMDELVSNTDELNSSVKIPVISMEDVPKLMREGD